MKRGAAIVVLLAAAAVVIALQVRQLMQSPALATRLVDDFLEYWTAGRLNLAGGNPYDPAQMFRAQQALAPDAEFPVMMWNPPWTLALAEPLGLLDYAAARVVWCLLSIGAVVVSAGWLWRNCGGPQRGAWLVPAASFAFLPTLFAVGMGQISPLVLLGLAAFLFFAQRGWWTAAGAGVALTLVKPHLVCLVWLALLLWSLHRRQWRVLLGAALALGAMTAVPLATNPAVFGQYVEALRARPPDYWIAPTPGVVLRLVLGWERTWLQLLPSLAGAAWLLGYWWRRREAWSWDEQMPLLALVSVLTAAYGWVFDQILLLLPVMQILVWHLRRPGRATAIGLAICLAANLIALALWPFPLLSGPEAGQPGSTALATAFLQPNTFWNVCLAPLFLAGYLAASTCGRSLAPALVPGGARHKCRG